MTIAATLGYMIVLFLLSATPGEEGDFTALFSSIASNLLHIPAYGVLAILWILTLRTYGMAERQSLIVAFILASGYGAGIEVHQTWVPGRFPSISDFLLDVAGILLFIGLYRQLKIQRPSARFRFYS